MVCKLWSDLLPFISSHQCVWSTHHIQVIVQAVSIQKQYFLFLLCWGALLGFKLRDSGFLNRHSTTSATPPALFCIGYFQDRVSQTICSGWPRAVILLISGSRIARHEPLAPGNISFLIQEFRWWAGYWWLTPIILTIWEAETGRIIVWGQPRETVLQTPSPK
jgi:hypothetical protein